MDYKYDYSFPCGVPELSAGVTPQVRVAGGRSIFGHTSTFAFEDFSVRSMQIRAIVPF